MTDAAALTRLADAARIIREAVRDKSYQDCPLGLVVRRYLRWKRNEWGATEATMRDYEIPLAYLCIDHADLEPVDFEPPVGTERVREFWDRHWAHRTPRTRAKNLSILRDFFRWCVREEVLHGDPTTAITRPRKRGTERSVFAPKKIELIIAAAPRQRDRVALRLVFVLGLRKGEISRLQLKHYDQHRQTLRIFGKGGKIRELPIVDSWLRQDMDLHWADRLERGDSSEYLLYPEKVGPRKDPDGPRFALNWEDRHKPLSSTAMHRWWHARLADAGVQPQKMHEGRHTAITDFVRESGSLKLAQLLAGHSSIQTTADIYAHLDVADLAEALRIVAERKAAKED